MRFVLCKEQTAADATLDRHVAPWRVATLVPLVPHSSVALDQLKMFQAAPLPLAVPYFPPLLREAYHFQRATVNSVCREVLRCATLGPMGVAPPLSPDGVRQDLTPAAEYVLAL